MDTVARARPEIAARLGEIAFELDRPVFSRVVGEHAPSARAAPIARRSRSEIGVERARRVGGGSTEKNLGVRTEQRLEPCPVVADDRHAARRRLEQPDARRVAGANHVGARQVQREALRRVERAMLGRPARCSTRSTFGGQPSSG